ncbi:MAG: hypothetical protein AAFS10_26465, partial [Myxococcota bacterium]
MFERHGEQLRTEQRRTQVPTDVPGLLCCRPWIACFRPEDALHLDGARVGAYTVLRRFYAVALCLEHARHGAIAMDYTGTCGCGRWNITVTTDHAPETLQPRVCDCSYCQAHPSEVISNPDLAIELYGDTPPGLAVRTTGDQLAQFYHCGSCGVLLAVGCTIDDQQRGAANALLLHERSRFGHPIPIQPRAASAE